jgi:hypothetical protein
LYPQFLRHYPFLKVYPNPATSQLIIEIKMPPLSIEGINIQLFNSFGQTVQSLQNIKNQELVMDLGDLPTGVYFLKVGDFALRKILINQ